MAGRIQLRARADLHFAFSGRTLLATDAHGVIGAHPQTGLFVDNARYLSAEAWLVDGRAPEPISASPVGAGAYLAYHRAALANDPQRPVFVEVARFVGEGMRTLVTLRNHGRADARLELSLRFDADFADTEEVENAERRQQAAVSSAWREDARELRLTYEHPDLDRATAIRIESDEGALRWDGDRLNVTASVAPQSTAELAWVVEPIVDGVALDSTDRRSFSAPTTDAERLSRDLEVRMPQLVTTNSTVGEAWRTAVSDLASLPLGLPDAPAAPIAGVPIYVEFFGRDTLTIGWQSLMATPDLLRDALLANAGRIGSVIDDWRDEEPGKMLHRAGGGPLSDLGMDPFDAYYGDWATPLDFLVMLGQYLSWTADRDTVRRLVPAARATLDWVDRYGDLDRDGFLEYDTRSPFGDKNQGWKDSADAIVDENGDFPDNPIATSELQGYWYAALQQAALVFGTFGDIGHAVELMGRARSLKRRFNRAFWMPDHGLYALGLTRDKRQLRSIGSNDGHLLASGIVPRRRGRRVAARLMERDIFSGWGIRTLADTHPAYDPFSYHRGSVWPVEQATIALGFARYGCWDELHRLADAVLASTELFVDHRLPEVLGGLPRDDRHPHPGIYPASCEPQGWSASAIVMLVQSLLGMVAFAPAGLLIVDPHLPPSIPDLRLEGVRVGGSELDLEFRRTSRRTNYRVTRRRGRVRVLRQPPPQAPGAGPVGRIAAALGSLPRL